MRKGSVIGALFLIVLGAYLLLREMGIAIPSGDVIWPVFVSAGGLVLLAIYIFGGRRDPGQVFLGVAAVLVGIVFFFVTFGPLEYGDLRTWWPVFVLIGGVAFLCQWIAAGFRDWGALFLGLVALVVGGVGLAITLQWLGPQTAQLLPKLWPLLVVLVGLMLLLRGLFARRS